jgi:hypothetical protein
MADLEKLFVRDPKDKSVRFMGKEMTAYIPKRYINLGQLAIADKVTTLGIFTMVVDGEKCGFQLPASIVTDPSDISEVTFDGVPCVALTFKHGDLFMLTTDVVQDASLGYVLWKEFMSLGNIPSYVTYDGMFDFFDDLAEITGRGINVNHSILEMVYAQVFRDSEERTKLYRNTDMKKPPVMIGVRDVAYGATSTHARVFGSYANQGMNAALLNPNSKNSDLEDIYRQ